MIKYLLFILISLGHSSAFSKPGHHLVSIPNPSDLMISRAKWIKSLDANQQLSFMIRLKIRNQDKLFKKVQEIYNPNSPYYQHFLTTAENAKDFLPLPETIHQVQDYFASHGMKTKIIHHHIQVTAKVSQIEDVLHVKMNQYEYQNQKAYANASTPQIPQEIAQHIAEFSLLNTIPRFQNDEEHSPKRIPPKAIANTTSLNGFTGANLQTTYNLQNIPTINGVKIDGSNQTIVIVDKCGTNMRDDIFNDANQYFNDNQINPFVRTGPNKNFAIINSDGTPFITCPDATSFSHEIDLDIEAAHTIATGSNTVLVLGSDQRSTLIDVIDTLISQEFNIAGFDNAYVISNSWSSIEESQDASLEAELALASANGITVNFSSGDCGDNTYITTKCKVPRASTPTVDYPSSSDYVTAVGATALFVDTQYRYAFETVWGSVDYKDSQYNYGGGTGGGISQFYVAVPWQSSISSYSAGGYGYINSLGNRRALPDISMLGDPQTGLLIVAGGQTIKDGGTSLACPLFSGTMVLVNQARNLLNKGTPIGQAAPYLYQKNQELQNARALHLIIPPAQIISGATPPPVSSINGTPAPASSFTIDNKTFGWDSSLTIEPENQFWNDAVGVGSPNIPNFVTAMANM